MIGPIRAVVTPPTVVPAAVQSTEHAAAELTLDAHIGARIRQEREARRLTQAQLAAAIGVTFQQVQKYERGVNRVAASRLVLVARALDTRVEDFLPSAGATPRDRSAVERLDQTASGVALAVAWDVLSPAHRDAVLTVALGLAGDALPPLARSMPEGPCQ